MIELIKSSVELLPDRPVLQAIEAAGRTCYKSEAKITPDSALPFVKLLCYKGHTAMLEHGTVYLKVPFNVSKEVAAVRHSKYSYCKYDAPQDYWYITTNMRVILEACAGDFDMAQDMVARWSVVWDSKFEKRVSFRIICDRGVSHELVRHRVFSFAQESTRYVTYGVKQPMRFIVPAWWPYGAGLFQWNFGEVRLEQCADTAAEARVVFTMLNSPSVQTEQRSAAAFFMALDRCAQGYAELLSSGQTAQQARAVLPNSLKTELVMTGTISQWEGFLKLRDDPAAHPDMQIVAKPISPEIQKILATISEEKE